MDIEGRGNVKGEKRYLGASVDWKGRPCRPNHGGMTAAAFALGLQAFEIMAIAAVGNNLITYVFNEMHFSLSKSANIVTNFVGTIFLLSILGGFLADSYLGSFWTILIFGFVELSGFILLSVQAHLPQFKPPSCNMITQPQSCQEAQGFQALIFFAGLYMVALGSGCVKPNMIAHGGDQFRERNTQDLKREKQLSTYFNWAYLSFCLGELVALTLLVWVQSKAGMDVGFGVSGVAMALGLVSVVSGAPFYRNKPPQGSIFTPIAQVFVAAITKRKQICPSNPELLHGNRSDDRPGPNGGNLLHTDKFRFLDKACIKIEGHGSSEESSWGLCTVTQVEQVKIILSVTPIFACTIIFNTILAQLQTFSVQQASAMNRRVSNDFELPPASLQAIPYLLLVFFVPLYEKTLVPMVRRITGKESGISPLQRIGCGLFTATFSMVIAALVENKRRKIALESNQILSVGWIAPQFLIFGLSEMFTAVGLIEFFYRQSIAGMQSFLTAMTYCSYSFGFFLSSLLVSLVNKLSKHGSHMGWFSNNDLNKDRLDLFYWLLAALSIINFFNYLFWSRWYSYNPSVAPSSPPKDYSEENLDFSASKHFGPTNM
ncbi:hypothetical protein AMTRI_Chr11g102040 [Amborella trichopoda]